MEYVWILWFLLAIVFAIIEMTNASFFIIWFGVGALGGMVTSFLTASITYQFLVFIIISVLLLLSTRKVTSKLTESSITPTNVDAVIGKIGIVVETIQILDEPGIIKVDGETWSAISADQRSIEKGEKAKVLEVRGVRLIVEKINSEEE